MLFSSFAFLIFFPIVTAAFYLTPYQKRWVPLLLASCYFYMFFRPVYILILAFTIVIDYFAGLLIEQATSASRRKLLLVASLVANIGVLAVFKYYNFLADNLAFALNGAGLDLAIPHLGIDLPIGLSFHTFQAMSYTIEVYRGNQKAERHPGIYALYVMFYPQLVAGPIERPQNILHQFHEKRPWDPAKVIQGLNLMTYGFFKKVAVADRLAPYVSDVFANPSRLTAGEALLGVMFFSVQIYCDFSGYSDIARGTALVMGYDLMENFKRPYLATSITEFWTRWHVSLSSWFRDYLYIPLGGSRCSRLRHSTNLMIVFLISGLWHGASWNFVIWGGLHGAFLVFGEATRGARDRAWSILPARPREIVQSVARPVFVFLLVSVAWVFFRATSTGQALEILSRLAHVETLSAVGTLVASQGRTTFALTLCSLALLGLSYRLPRDLRLVHSGMFLVVTILLTVLLGRNSGADFIYFQF